MLDPKELIENDEALKRVDQNFQKLLINHGFEELLEDEVARAYLLDAFILGYKYRRQHILQLRMEKKERSTK